MEFKQTTTIGLLVFIFASITGVEALSHLLHKDLKVSPACGSAVQMLSSNKPYSNSFATVMSLAEELSKDAWIACAMTSQPCQIPTPDADDKKTNVMGNSTVPMATAQCCATEMYPLWQVKKAAVDAMLVEGYKMLPYPKGGLLWFGLGLEMRLNGTLFAMGWAHAQPFFVPQSCMNTRDIDAFIKEMNEGCVSYSDDNIACGYNLLMPTF